MQYNPNNPDSIRAIFNTEGDALAHAGYQMPDEVRVTADDVQPTTIPQTPGELAAQYIAQNPLPEDASIVEMNQRNAAFVKAAINAGFLATKQ